MRSLCLFAALLVPVACEAQVTGAFSLDKATFAPGEPVLLSFTLTNTGDRSEEVATADPYAFCSGFQIHVAREGGPSPACFEGYAGSCVGGALLLPPGASHTEHLLLNYQNRAQGDMSLPVSGAGGYTIDAIREINFAPPSEHSRSFSAPDQGKVHQVLTLRVDETLQVSSSIYDPYVEQLESKDFRARQEAARTLTTLAPRTLEPLLIPFATSPDWAIRQFAPLALARLGTEASLSTLAQMLLHTEPGSYEYMMAAQSLGETHDPAWFPLLLKIADQQGPMYLRYAAESGGSAAIPALLARLNTADSGAPFAIADALGRTASRAAIPPLIALLGPAATSREASAQSLAVNAGIALTRLTHVSAEQGLNGSEIPSWQARWQRWWTNSGSTAPIYPSDECAAETKLP